MNSVASNTILGDFNFLVAPFMLISACVPAPPFTVVCYSLNKLSSYLF